MLIAISFYFDVDDELDFTNMDKKNASQNAGQYVIGFATLTAATTA